MTKVLVPRPTYMAQLEKYSQTSEIKVLKGMRRCGKSTLLALYADSLVSNGVPQQNVCLVKLDGYDVPIGADAQWLMGHVSQRLEQADPGTTTYVLLDEVQEIAGWEDPVRRLRNRPDTQVVITGSNARVLSSDLATLMAGRYVEIDVWPLSFAEYRAFADAYGWESGNTDRLMADYITWGGMPGLFDFDRGDQEAYGRMLSAVFDTVVLKDVLARSSADDPDLLQRLVRYVFSTSGNLFSTKRIVDALASSGRKASQQTVDNYLRALEDSLIVCRCEQAGVAGKETLRPRRKYYPVDTGLRNLTVGFNRIKDLGFQLEDVVYCELRRRGFDVRVGALRSSEIDFVATRGSEREYVQVCQSVLADDVYLREIAPLEAVGDSFPKLVIVADDWRTGVTETGVRIRNIADWLCDGADRRLSY